MPEPTLLSQFDEIVQNTKSVPMMRELILHLAVQGRLVGQDPKDEPASVLLEKIKAEKERLVKAGKVKKIKTMPPITSDEIPHQLPEGWIWARIGDIVDNYHDKIVDGPFGSSLLSSEYQNEGIPIIRIQNVSRNEFINKNIKYISTEKAKLLSRHNFIAGDIVLNKLGEPVGKACVVPDGLPKGIIVADIIRIRLNEDIFCKQYVVNAINSLIFIEQLNSYYHGITRQRVNLTVIRSLLIPLPPIAEQHRIVARVQELMALCDRLEAQQKAEKATCLELNNSALHSLVQSEDAAQLDESWALVKDNFDTLYNSVEALDKLQEAILQLAVQGRLVEQDPKDEPAGVLLERIQTEKGRLVKAGKIRQEKPLSAIKPEEMPYELPKGWKWVRLGEICYDIHYGFTASANASITDVKMLRITDIQDNYVHWDDVPGCQIEKELIPKYKLAEGDILIARTGGTIGKTYLMGKVDVVAVFASYLIRAIPSSLLNVHYLKRVLESPLYWTQLYEKSRGGGQPNVNAKNLGKLIMPLCSITEQHRIVTRVEELMALTNALKEQIRASGACREELMGACVEEVVRI